MSERNLVVLRGTIVAEPRTRELPSGSVLSQFDVTTRDSAGAQSVPVAWFDPPAAVADLTTGADVVVIGTVRRRFFKAGGATQSRTEVVADKVVPARRRRDAERAVEAACRALQSPADGHGGGGRREDRMSWGRRRGRQSSRTTKPVRSFGVKNVDFGGISRPSRAVRSISAMLTGRISTAAVAVPASTAASTSSRPCW